MQHSVFPSARHPVARLNFDKTVAARERHPRVEHIAHDVVPAGPEADGDRQGEAACERQAGELDEHPDAELVVLHHAAPSIGAQLVDPRPHERRRYIERFECRPHAHRHRAETLCVDSMRFLEIAEHVLGVPARCQ